jgi:hypothetical protein
MIFNKHLAHSLKLSSCIKRKQGEKKLFLPFGVTYNMLFLLMILQMITKATVQYCACGQINILTDSANELTKITLSYAN